MAALRILHVAPYFEDAWAYGGIPELISVRYNPGQSEGANFIMGAPKEAKGARGSLLQLAQIAAIVGQQALRGKRIDIGFTDRTLPYFGKNDLAAPARGFVKDGYKAGMNPAEFFFLAQEGLITLHKGSPSGKNVIFIIVIEIKFLNYW
jgi:hypothetical protein